MNKSTLLFCLASCLVLFLQAQDCAPGWAYFRSVTVDNSSGESLTDYQVSFTLNTADLVTAGKLQADGADLRVYADDCTPLPFWGDSLGTSAETRIYAKIPAIAAGGSVTLQVYYGNEMAESAADGDNTFIFFDDFNDAEVDADKWEAVGEFDRFQTNAGLLQYASTSLNPGPRFKFARSKMSFSDKVIFDFVIERTNADGYGFSSVDMDLDRILFRDSGFGFDTLNIIAIMDDTLDNGFATETLYPLLRFDRFAFQTVSITAETNEQNEIVISRFANEGLGDENTDTHVVQNINMSGFHFIVSGFGPSFIIEMDNFRVRQHTDTPPTSTTGAEMDADPSSVRHLIDPTLVQVYPNPANERITLNVDWPEEMVVQFSDARGRMIPNISTTLSAGTQQTLSVNELPAGLYYLQLRRASDGVLLHSRQLNIAR